MFKHRLLPKLDPLAFSIKLSLSLAYTKLYGQNTTLFQDRA
jgi:hypothetical protein